MSVLQQDTMEMMGRRYRYDALNRLKSVDALMGVGFTAFGGYRERFSYDRDGNITRLTRYAKASVMDSLKYNYYAGNNRLEYVNDAVSIATFTNDIDNQNTANYKYDKTGNLIEDVSESTRIHWTYYNKVKQIDSVKLTPPKYGLVWATKLRMKYDALGNRVVKENPKRKVKEVYVRDAQGNAIALYEVKQDSLYSKEFYMYGSNRLGYLEDEVFLGRKCIGKFCNIVANPVNPMPFIGTQKTLPTLPPVVIQPISSSSVSIVFGKKRYELSDWLGNVRVVINDRKTPINSGSATVGYKAQVVSVSDYYSFGSEIAERTYDPVKPFYRFGFNTQEKTFELNRDHYTAKFWEYDARLGRRWNVDPKPNAALSNYAVLNGNPILYSDPLGDTIRIKEDNKFISYAPGMEYKGDNKFIASVVGTLNKINSTEAGGKLLSELVSSKNNFDFTNLFAKDNKGNDITNALSFSEYKDGGGEIKAGALLNDYMQEGQKIETVAHELFHGYQSEKGERGATINREVGAYLFGKAIATNLGYTTMGFGNLTKAGRNYDKAMMGLLFSDTFSQNLYKTALQNFKAGSFENASGLYNNFKILLNDNNPVIKSFFPLVK